MDDVCELISVTVIQDELGQDIETELPRQAFCSKLSVSRAEFFAAGQAGLKPQLLLVVDSDEYDKEQKIICEGKNYIVYRDFMRADGYTELYCEVRAGG